MTEDASTARLVLMTPPVQDPDGWPGALGDALLAAVAAAPVDAVLLRLPKLDDRSLVKHLKPLVARLQEHNVAVLLEDGAEIVARAGADGCHVSDPARLHEAAEAMKSLGRMVGVGNLRARHDAMEAAEEGCEYVLFGEPRRDGSLQPLSGVLERAQWWAELFQTPCIAYAPTLDDVAPLAATGCEFVALCDGVFSHPEGPADAVLKAHAALAAAATAPAR